MAGYTPYHASAYISLLHAGTSSSDSSTSRLERKSQYGGRGRASKQATRKQKRTAALMGTEDCELSSVEKKRKQRRERTSEEIEAAEAEWADATAIDDDDDEAVPDLLDPDVGSSDEDDGANVWAMISKKGPGTPSPFRGAGSLLLVVITMVRFRGQVIWARISPVSKNVFGYLRGQDQWLGAFAPLIGQCLL